MSYFVKQISLQDLAGASMMPDRRFFGIMGRVSKTNEWLRPQLLGRVVIFNAPSWAKLAFRIASNFISQKTLSKVWIHRQTPSGALCPYGARLLRVESLPTNLGGLCTCDGRGCVGGRPNASLEKPMPEEIPSSLSELVALRRLPCGDDLPLGTAGTGHTAPQAVEAQPCEPTAEPWCRRCCKRRRPSGPLAASADHV
ncbi:unnamed protein product [Durusdinium trenchii]